MPAPRTRGSSPLLNRQYSPSSRLRREVRNRLRSLRQYAQRRGAARALELAPDRRRHIVDRLEVSGPDLGTPEPGRLDQDLCLELDLSLNLHLPLIRHRIAGGVDHVEQSRRRRLRGEYGAVAAVIGKAIATFRGADDRAGRL